MLQQENYAIPGMKSDVTKKAQDLEKIKRRKITEG